MLKINLLNSVTERQSGAVVAVDKKVSSPATRLLVIALVTLLMTVAVIGWDILSTQMAKAAAERELENQKQIAAELEAVMKEQKELEARIKNIDDRIAAIKKLREEQRGPSAVLEALRERIGMLPGLFLQSVEQSGDTVTIKGNSPSEEVVTRFGQSLEFSNGLFSNLNIETQRQEVTNQLASTSATGETPKVNVVNFTIKAGYNSARGGQAGVNMATNASTTAPQSTNGQPAPPTTRN
jgi:Tfp pilus assembly protein PilN